MQPRRPPAPPCPCLRNPIHCIIPPHIAKRLADSRDPSIRKAGQDLLAESARFRGLREAAGGFRPEPPRNGAAAAGGLRRKVYDAQHGIALPGKLVAKEGDKPSGMKDPAVREAYEGLGATYDLFQSFGRDSIDGNGSPLIATVHYRRNFNNAFWDGVQMVFGDGDGRLFNRFTAAVDVIGHELAHGVIGATAGLVYRDQPGAINEHFADVFGILVKQKTLNQSPDKPEHWLIGQGILGPDIDNGNALRSMDSPGSAFNDDVLGKDPQVGHFREYEDIEFDNGGVHIYSGIPNRAFCIAARRIGRPAWEDAGRIWYDALLALRGRPEAQFTDLVSVTRAAAAQRFGAQSTQAHAVEEAWDAVGLGGVAPGRLVTTLDNELERLLENMADLLAPRIAMRLRPQLTLVAPTDGANSIETRA